MAYNEKMTLRLREALADVPKVEEKKMFRGVTFMVNGKMMASAGDDQFMFRIDPELHDEALEKEGVTPVIMKGRSYKGYIRVHEDAVQSKRELGYWIKLALEFNKIAKASAKKKKEQ